VSWRSWHAPPHGWSPRLGAGVPRAGRSALRSGDRSPQMTFPLIDQEQTHQAVSLRCRVLGVSHAGFYAWHPGHRRPGPSPIGPAGAGLAIQERSRGTSGAPGSRPAPPGPWRPSRSQAGGPADPDAQRTPFAVVLAAANSHDSTLLNQVIDAVPAIIGPRGRPGRPHQRPARLHADKGYHFPRCRKALRRRASARGSPAAVRCPASGWAATAGRSSGLGLAAWLPSSQRPL
jgi:hypothetical protein